MSDNVWRKCSTCGKPINFNSTYQVCSVSTCKKHAYCTVDCWDLHLSVMNHKEAWAEEERAPSAQAQTNSAPKRRIIVSGKTSGSTMSSDDLPRDVLIVASKLKAYIKAKGDMNTSGNVMDRLSDIVRGLANDAIDHARSEGRKTVMDRDFL